MSDEIKLGDIVVFKTDNRAFEVIGKYIVPDDRLWRVEAITEDDPPTPDRNRKYRLVAVDCPNVMLDEIPEIYVESYSEKLERELEEQRKEALKMNRNEIKQGDKVRVSKDAPWLYVGGLDRIFAISDSVVTAIEDDNAAIKCYHGQAARILIIPTKYLVKVDAEAKEAKFKKGDMVRYRYDSKLYIVECKTGKYHYALRQSNGDVMMRDVLESDLTLYTEPTPKYKKGDRVKICSKNAARFGCVGTILEVHDSGTVDVDFNDYYVGGHLYSIDFIEPYTEPTEQTEAEKKPYDGISEETANEISNMLEAYAKALSGIADSFDWQRYAADLAKEVALKVANKYNDPEQAAEYAVQVAKAIVEGLKRK